MPHRMWKPNVAGVHHNIVARWSPWTFAGELVVDGRVIESWGGLRLMGTSIKFDIEGHPASLSSTLTDFDLLIDGKKVLHE